MPNPIIRTEQTRGPDDAPNQEWFAFFKQVRKLAAELDKQQAADAEEGLHE